MPLRLFWKLCWRVRPSLVSSMEGTVGSWISSGSTISGGFGYKFVNGNTDDPYYYIQYNKIVCRPAPLKKGDPYDCSSCTPGEYCPTLQRCVWKVWKYCPDDPNYITCQKTNCAPERKWLKKMERRKRLGFIDEIPGT